MVPAREEATPTFLRKGTKMKSFLASVLIAVLGVWTIGCENQKGTTENKTETTTSQTKDGETTAQRRTGQHEDNHQPGDSRRWRRDDRNNDEEDQ